MEENQSGLYGQERLLGRRVIVILPVFVLVVAITFAYLALPVRYFFEVDGGELHLSAGKFPWVGVHRIQDFDPIPVEGLNITELSSKMFNSQTEAFSVLKGVFLKRVQYQNKKLFAKEKEMAKPYTALLKDLRIARSIGTEGLDEQINVLQGWIDLYSKKTEASEGELPYSEMHK